MPAANQSRQSRSQGTLPSRDCANAHASKRRVMPPPQRLPVSCKHCSSPALHCPTRCVSTPPASLPARQTRSAAWLHAQLLVSLAHRPQCPAVSRPQRPSCVHPADLLMPGQAPNKCHVTDLERSAQQAETPHAASWLSASHSSCKPSLLKSSRAAPGRTGGAESRPHSRAQHRTLRRMQATAAAKLAKAGRAGGADGPLHSRT